MKKALKILIPILVVIAIVLCVIVVIKTEEVELVSIKTEKELEKIYENNNYTVSKDSFLKKLITLPFSAIGEMERGTRRTYGVTMEDSMLRTNVASGETSSKSIIPDTTTTKIYSNTAEKDYSTTNVQVENVDEADITKTDGDYIYSISENKVVITDVKNPEEIKIASTINMGTDSFPEEMILCEDKLVVIVTNTLVKKNNTIVNIYDIQNRENPKSIKSYELYQGYYTSRAIGNKIYVIASGNLRKEKDKVLVSYKEDRKEIDIGLDNIKYLKDVKTNSQTIMSMIDIDNIEKGVSVKSYLMDIENAYISEKNIYLLDSKYENEKNDDNDLIPITKLFGTKGIFGLIEYEERSGIYSPSELITEIYKFNILEDGNIKYKAKAKVEGKTINQFSVDEYNENVRVALQDNYGSRVVVLNEKLDKIGQTPDLAEGEKMYSSRFMGDKAYLVTYKTVDPLFVIDLSNPNDPEVLGELKIPGYSTYLHPYDENHLIGIGMETKENVNRNSSGKVISTSARIVGMKMALFNIEDPTNPKEVSNTVIGDSRTTSAILTNHKALLFSKERNLIAIPVNNYEEDFEISSVSGDNSSMIESYKKYNENYISEGYLVYNINLEEGFELKGSVVHEKANKTSKYSYYSNSKLLRGLYIDDNLFTISEDMLKINNLEDMRPINELKIKEGK